MKRIFLSSIILTLFSICVFASGVPSPDLADLTFDENIETPVVPKKASPAIVKHIENIRATFSKHGLKAESERSGEVVIVTIPCSELFAPNSTTLLSSGEKYLRPFSRLLKYPTMYKVIVAVHSDNSGEPEYLEALTSARASAIDSFLISDSGTTGTSLVPYGLAMDMPLNENRSIADRAENRRVEIYIVPNKDMIEMAKSGKLN